ncbi:MAG: TonB-dependent receptor plug domain-containing protein, partial [Cruoricaptor ignavus]|nr:TonB-dependent receptor plug domain-containing protein [Cruoricaptor ignavus]
MKRYIFGAALLHFALFSAQKNDSLQIANIQEIIVIGTNSISSQAEKPLGSIDEYLQKATSINMIKRGAYAWEPVINNMATERTVVTIDGMRIFSACTDKMDPVTSYVEISNLSEAEVSSGQQGSCHGSTIGGTLDLNRNKGNFGTEKWDFSLNSGYESVNQQEIFGGGIKFRNEKIFADTNFMTRDAENYKAGGNTEVLYSQFKKINFSGTFGFKINEQQTLESSVIYDKATDVGYPALPMDVSLAEAVIASLRYNYRFDNSIFKN